jgi:hypothetical protein
MYASEIGIDTIFQSDELLEHIFRLPIPEAASERNASPFCAAEQHQFP